MKDLAFEAVQPRDVRILRYMQRAGSQHPVMAVELVPGFRGQRPARTVLVKLGGDDLLVEADVRANLVFVRGVPDVILNFIPGRITFAPVRLTLEGIRIQVRLHIACTARVGVVAPGAADVVGFFQHHKIVDAGFLEFNRHAQAAEAGPDDHDLGLFDAGGVGCFLLTHSPVSYC